MTAIKNRRLWIDSWQRRLSAPVAASSLAAFRILFGLVMFCGMARFLARGWVKTIYLDPLFHFPWWPLIRPWPGAWMYAHLALLALFALGVALGWFYRISAILFCAGFTYLEFIDRTTYLNHYYLAGLLSFLLVFMPAHCQWSIDAWRNPAARSATVPVWTIWLLRFQLLLVYWFAGLAKLNADWLFSAEPLRIWLMPCSGLPVIGKWLAEPWAAVLASWCGAAHDLFIPFLLLCATTRFWAYLAAVVFHVLTAFLFPIGMFPWIMLATITIFFSPAWPDRILQRRPKGNPSIPVPRISRAGMCLLAAYGAFQVWMPLRAWLHPQQGAWDLRGFNFAWRVMLVEKTGCAEFFAFDPQTGGRKKIELSNYITPRQEMMMAQDPFQIRALAQYLGGLFPGREIQVDAFATLNGRPSQPLVRANVNLAAPRLKDWIVPLNNQKPDGF